ncbi:hypothetical protein Tco_0766584 [Tanacetum coccineum]
MNDSTTLTILFTSRKSSLDDVDTEVRKKRDATPGTYHRLSSFGRGVIANNLTLLTLLEAHKYMPGSSSQKRKFVVWSLGTGVANKTGAYDATEMTGWGSRNITYLGRDEAKMDISTSENMNSLANVRRRLLDQQAERNTIGVTNRIALKRLASFLHHKRMKSCKSD